nr:carbonic anhydrase [Prorocentrum minimum]
MGERNRLWRQRITKEEPGFFDTIASGQSPSTLWIGCSDSRVAPENLVYSKPGEIFVHRNIANMVISTDTNLRSVIHYAVFYLKVKHIVVCGHYDCGGVRASTTKYEYGAPLDSWLTNIRDVSRLHAEELSAIIDDGEKLKKLVELNVTEQCLNLFKTADVQKRRAETNKDGGCCFPRIHGMVFSPEDGVLKRLDVDFSFHMKKMKHIYNLYEENADRGMWASYHGAVDDMI